jgi:hypothetical protein
MKVVPSLKMLWQDIKANNDQAGKILCQKGLAVHWRIALAQELPRNYLEGNKQHTN